MIHDSLLSNIWFFADSRQSSARINDGFTSPLSGIWSMQLIENLTPRSEAVHAMADCVRKCEARAAHNWAARALSNATDC